MKNKKAISSVTFFNSRLTAVISISLVLFLLGLIILFGILANNLTTYVKESISFDIVLNEKSDKAQIDRLLSRLNKFDYIKSTEYISKEDALKQIEEEIGQNPEEFLGYNPLPAMIVVRVKSDYANIDSLKMVEKQIRGLDSNIKSIDYRKELIDIMNDNLAKIGIFLLGLSILLLLISFALINNTIRLMIYSKRFLIHTMKLVGATPGFIRRPFIGSHIVSGIIAAVIANALLFWLLYYQFYDIKNIWDIIFPVNFFITSGIVLLLGILISIIATVFAVNKYLRSNVDELYHI
ncbi:MAG: permease-like cell division protein FtsX [Dysgonamonadaceae bacterium]|jgi:cell division transport system permease protein|nr:permease-like cell division protein FtsX [Dysgonamonadaceae bacterium]